MHKPIRIVACPTCKKTNPWTEENRWRPFCSKRCSDIDLGAWANEAYRIPVEQVSIATDMEDTEEL